MKLRRKLPDCDDPLLNPHLIFPATGFAGLLSYRRKELRSRGAAYPMPSTSGSFAVKVNVYSTVGSKPSFMQILPGSGVPGNAVVRQSANAQALGGSAAGVAPHALRSVINAFDV